MIRRIIVIALVAVLVTAPGWGAARAAPVSLSGNVSVRAAVPVLAVTGLTYAPQPFDPSRRRAVATVSFTLSRPADVTMRITDWTGATVDLQSRTAVSSGPASLAWAGRNLAGRLVAPSWYTCTVLAIAGSASAQSSTQIAVSYGKSLTIKAKGVAPGKFKPPATCVISAHVSRDAFVATRITNSSGVIVRSMTESLWPAGFGSFTWDGRSNAGALVPRGMYMCAFTGRDSSGNTASVSQSVTVR